MQKRLAGSSLARDEGIFFALSERDGKNSKGQIMVRDGSRPDMPIWDTVDHDFAEVVDDFRAFRTREAIEFRS